MQNIQRHKYHLQHVHLHNNKMLPQRNVCDQSFENKGTRLVHAATLGWSTVISTLESWGTHWIFCSQWTQKDHIEPNFWLEMGPSYWPRLMLLEQTGPSGRQLRRPFWAICHCERGSEMCLELTGSLWGFQKWCDKVKSDQKWPSYSTLKVTNFYKSEPLWRRQDARPVYKALFRPPPPLGRNSNFWKLVIFKAP